MIYYLVPEANALESDRPVKDETPPLSKTDFAALSEFRYQMRRYERFSENAVQAEGITPLQYLLLLHIKGFSGREWATVGELAERLQAKQHGVVALITRCEAGASCAARTPRTGAASKCTCCRTARRC
jgi:hypothetical protein